MGRSSARSVLTVEDPTPDSTLADVFVPEAVIAEGESAGDDEYLAEAGLRYEAMLHRIIGGLPVVRGGRTVAALEELPPVQDDL